MFDASSELFSVLGSGFAMSSLFYACIFFLSFSLGLFLRSALPSKKPSSRPKRFIAACIFLSLTVILYTILIFLTSSLFPLPIFESLHVARNFSKESYYCIMLAFCLSGFLISFLWKVLIPVFAALCALFSVLNFYLLASEFEIKDERLNVAIDEKTYSVDSVEFERVDGENFIEFEAVFLPETLPLPLKRNWLRMKKGAEEKQKDSKLPDFMKNPAVDFYRDSVLMKNRSSLKVLLPEAGIYPSLFSAEISFRDGAATCTFTRDL